jgi:cytoskeletal protein RodZ
MATVAELLRNAREEQKLNIYQVAEITKIKTDHIRALEAGQYDAFSATVYIRGFVRTYAKALKLDVAQVSAVLDAELARTDRFSEPPPLMDRPRGTLDFVMLQLSKLNWRVLGTGLGVGMVLLILFFSLRGCGGRSSDPLKRLGPGLYQPTNASGELLPLPERKR